MLILRVNVAAQMVEALEDGVPTWSAPVSTALAGVGEEEGSLRTPRGRFHVEAKIGAGAEPGTEFKSRVPTGRVWSLDCGWGAGEDLVLTRILWLAGDEPQNANTLGRYIYFHGTNHEDAIGAAGSHGCIRLRNDDIIALFELVEEGTPVEIL